MKAALVLATALAACAAPTSTETQAKRTDVVLFAAAPDVADAWMLRPSDFEVDRPLHVTRVFGADGAGLDAAITVMPGDEIAIDGVSEGGGVVAWY